MRTKGVGRAMYNIFFIHTPELTSHVVAKTLTRRSPQEMLDVGSIEGLVLQVWRPLKQWPSASGTAIWKDWSGFAKNFAIYSDRIPGLIGSVETTPEHGQSLSNAPNRTTSVMHSPALPRCCMLSNELPTS
jgi:hypothetical protein